MQEQEQEQRWSPRLHVGPRHLLELFLATGERPEVGPHLWLEDR